MASEKPTEDKPAETVGEKEFEQLEAREDRWQNFREWATVALLVCTTVGVFWQVHEMIKVYGPIRDQAEANQQSAAAAKASADAARDAVNLAKANAEIQLRPYVFIEANGVNVTANGLEADLVAKNAGQTPAYRAHVRGLVSVVDFPLKGGEVPARFEDGPKGAVFHVPHHNTNVLGPGRELRFVGVARSFDPRDMAEVNKGGAKRILVAGAFYYSDVYRNIHYTKYCMLYAGLTLDTMTFCNEHDEAK
jgi:hypothetical protein